LKNENKLNGFVIKTLAFPEEYSSVLARAAKHNTYIETISDKADNLHLKIKENYLETLPLEYFHYVKQILRQKRLGTVDLIGDVTEEDYYGKVSGLHIIPWTGEDGIEGKFCYLVISILFRNKMLPIYAVLLHLGQSKAEVIGKAINLCQELGLKIGKILLDRGFYSGAIIDELKMRKVNYLIFVPKKTLFKCMLEGTDKNVVIEHVIKYNANFTVNKVETEIALIKEVVGYDWVFATNLGFMDIKRYVRIYRRRWNIETMFRIHDEARIKTKSKVPIVRLFYFLVSMLLMFIWSLVEKNKITFKLFVIMLFEESKTIAPQKIV
jgi:hypothetical protein